MPTLEHVGALPEIGPAPAGTWTSVSWVAGGRVPSPVLEPDGESRFVAASWSGGYIAFWSAAPARLTDATVSKIYFTTSKDGLRWTPLAQLPSVGLTSIEGLVESNGVLIALGMPMGGVCGRVELSAIWTSRDGVSWTGRDTTSVFLSGGAFWISAGGAGFIAEGGADGAQAIWTSRDGASWTRRGLPVDFTLGNTISFSGGFVLAGVEKTVLTGGCASGDVVLTPAVYWSVDGASWARAALPGAGPTPNGYTRVCRLSDRALVAIAYAWSADGSAKTVAWTTTDGRNWARRTEAQWLDGDFVTDGGHGIVTHENQLFFVDDQLELSAIAQHGDATGGGAPIVGRTGLLRYDFDGYVWLGIPKAA